MIKRHVKLHIVCSLCIVLLFGCVSAFADSDTITFDYVDIPLQEVQEIKTEVTLMSVSSSNTTGFKSVVLGLLGDYNPVVTDHTYQSSGSYISHSIDIQPDYSWICSAGIFALVLYCIFRLFGGFISK